MSQPNEGHRHLTNHEPIPPFEAGQRVVIVTTDADSMFINGVGGIVTSVDYRPDPEDAFGPWQVGVLVDAPIGLQMAFSSTELRHADDDTEDFAATGEVPAIPFREDVPATPIFDQIREEALAVDGFANQIEADLRVLTERNAR